MKPVVYDFSINERGTFAELKTGDDAILPDGYYNIVLPRSLAQGLNGYFGMRARRPGAIQRLLA